jgi:hypothetical protein
VGTSEGASDTGGTVGVPVGAVVTFTGLAVGGREGGRVVFVIGEPVGTTGATGARVTDTGAAKGTGAATGAGVFGTVGLATGVGTAAGIVGTNKYGGKVNFTGWVACRVSLGMVGAEVGAPCFETVPVAPKTSVDVPPCAAPLVPLLAFLVGAGVGAGEGSLVGAAFFDFVSFAACDKNRRDHGVWGSTSAATMRGAKSLHASNGTSHGPNKVTKTNTGREQRIILKAFSPNAVFFFGKQSIANLGLKRTRDGAAAVTILQDLLQQHELEWNDHIPLYGNESFPRHNIGPK